MDARHFLSNAGRTVYVKKNQQSKTHTGTPSISAARDAVTNLPHCHLCHGNLRQGSAGTGTRGRRRSEQREEEEEKEEDDEEWLCFIAVTIFSVTGFMSPHISLRFT